MGPRVALPPDHLLSQKQRGNLSLKALPGRPGPTVEAELCAFPSLLGWLAASSLIQDFYLDGCLVLGCHTLLNWTVNLKSKAPSP